MSIFDKIKSRGGSVTSDPETDAMWTTPWSYRDESGTYYGYNDQVWLYRSFPLSPIQWEDGAVRLSLGQQLGSLLLEVGLTSTAPVGGLKQTGNNRQIHIVSMTWQDPIYPPQNISPELSNFISENLNFAAPQRSLIIGVRLRHDSTNNQNNNFIDQAKSLATKVLLEDVPDRASYAKDRDFLHSILARYGAKVLDEKEYAHLESWYNNGKGTDTTIIENVRSVSVPTFDDFELSTLMKFNNFALSSPDNQWVLEALAHPHGPSHISIRAELEPSTVTRARARRSQRKIDASIKEEQASGELERVEYSNTFQVAKQLEDYLVDVSEPILSATSFIMVRPIREADETYVDMLKNRYGIELKPLEHRQLRAIDETLPTSSRRVNPFLQDVSISMLAHAGLVGFSNIGDKYGGFIGLSQPDYTPVYLDYGAASKENKPPAMLVAGDPGSGKTMLCQLLSYQATLNGVASIFINPKGYDSLSSFAEAAGGRVVKMSALEKLPGAFDPFRYAPPTVAAEIATNFILSVLGNTGGFTQAQQLELGSALKRGAVAGARCVADCFDFIEDQQIITQVRQQVESSSLFALGIALEPLEQLTGLGGLTLIEFDRPLDLPDPTKPANAYTRPELISMAALRIVTRASMEILMSSNGGVLVVDEAWTFLGSPEGLSALQRLGREGRSLNVLPIFATQRIADVISRDMESYLSRVFCMKMTDPREAAAALKLCGLEPTPARLAWLRDCGPRRGNDDMPSQPALALHRDIENRHSSIVIGPIPEYLMKAFSTNPEDRLDRENKNDQNPE